MKTDNDDRSDSIEDDDDVTIAKDKEKGSWHTLRIREKDYREVFWLVGHFCYSPKLCTIS